MDSAGGKNYTCKSQWVDNVYDGNECGKVLDPYPTNEKQLENRETIRENCFKANQNLKEGTCSFVEGLFADNFTDGIDCFWNKYQEPTEIIRNYWRTNAEDQEDLYEVCSVKNHLDYKTQPFKCKSQWYKPDGTDGYIKDYSNQCYATEAKYGDDRYNHKDELRADCEKKSKDLTEGKCAFIDGVYYNKHEFDVDCFWNRYSENQDLIRNFWRSNPQDAEIDGDEAYDVCSVEIFGKRIVKYKCHDIGKKPDDDKGLSGGVIAIIIIAIAIFVVGLGGFLFLFLTKKGPFAEASELSEEIRNKNTKTMEMNSMESS